MTDAFRGDNRLLAAVAAFALTVPGAPEIPRLPPIQRDPQITYVDKTGAVIGVRGGRFASLDISRLPKHVPAAVVSIEDRRFYEHAGFDPRGMASAIVGGLSGGRMRGASTITQQTARLLFLNQARTL